MTKLLVMSDIHGKWNKALEILELEKYDLSINLGDTERQESLVKRYFDHYVGGNNDWGFSIEEKVIEIEGLRIGLLHGHTRGIYVQETFQEAIDFALDVNVKLVLHGHSHIVRHKKDLDINVICPGSIRFARSSYGQSYALLTIDNGKLIDVQFKKVN